MPFGEEHSSQVVVSVNGTALPPAATAMLASAYVDDSVHVPSMAVLRFSDAHHDILGTIGAKIGAAVSVAVQQSGQGAPVPLFDGDVTALEKEIDETGAFTTVRALDVRCRLQSGAKVEAFTEMSVTDVVGKVLREAGLQAQVGPFTTKHKHLSRDGESDWELLCRLARTVGAAVWVRGRTVHFDTPTTASTAPSGTDPRVTPEVLSAGRNLLSFRATVTASTQVPEVEARGWDYTAKRDVVAPGRVETQAAVLQTTPVALARDLKGTKHLLPVSGLATLDAARTAATVSAAARAGGFAEVEGLVRGNPRLRAATAVNVVDVGPEFSGKYVLTTVRHDFAEREGYVTSFSAADVSDRSVYGVIAGGQPPAAAGWKATTALVTNVKDPDNHGRVKVKFPFADGYESWWARPVQLGAGAQRGVSWLPEVNDEVLVAFGGSFDEPYVLGGLYNGKDVAGAGWAAHVHSDGSVKRRALTSRTGMVVEFLEDGQQDALTVSTNNGAQHLTLTQTGQKGVVLISQGPLEVTAEQDITVTGKKNVSVTTSTGDLSLKAMNVTIEASAKLALMAAQLSADAQASAALTGATVKVDAKGTAELTSAGVTTVRGSLVKIN
ncbi:VgrG-related protein [Georgenia satyanarayanai]|uniref:VgrG-related protein n=1 Tax=Georgenia satyanarayanai TaxID=860221 RepID=UPI00203A4634|nr:VgrG-related protein [Georgenia satyanarayanai]MCM3661587.1 VgrG-related protein [Georgenia satyanarayanai]